jgi:hemerythrin-like domain-containing protein
MERISHSAKPSRRSFLTSAMPAGGAVLFSGNQVIIAQEGKKQGGGEEGVSTNEDLMREHGILKRVLLAYEEIIRRIHARQDFPPQAVLNGATIIRKFIEEYHEKLEEDHLFPRFRQAGKLVDLVTVLYAQHQAGRRVTERIMDRANGSLKSDDDRSRLAADLEAFNRMYAPHEAREDTVLFPMLHKIVSAQEYDALGEQFEKIERKTFGGDGFDIYVDKVAALEKQLGIHDLAKFTPS